MRARPILPVLVAALLVAPPGRPAAATTVGLRVAARHAILVDADGGAVLWGRASRTARPPASLTKMLTALAVRASLDLDGRVAASRLAARQPSRRLAVRRGQRLTVEQALEALMIASANDVAVMLAEGAGGSVGRFARAMDAESERLGLRQSHWRNPHGLDAPGHRSSAFDLAILARVVLRDRERGSRVTDVRPDHLQGSRGLGNARASFAGQGRPHAPGRLHQPERAPAHAHRARGSCSVTAAPSGSRRA